MKICYQIRGGRPGLYETVLAAVTFELKTVWNIIAYQKLKDLSEVVKDGNRARYCCLS